MGLFDWDPRYDIGVEQMNREHKMLLGLMAKLQSASDARATKPMIVATLDELCRCTVNHFRAEEMFMESINYADRKTHAVIHKGLLEKLDVHRKAFVNGPAVTLSIDFFQFLKLWLSSHILGIDMRYGATVRKSA